METGAGIVLIGHYNKNGEVSGSTGWKNQVRNVIVVEHVEGCSTRRRIRIEKSNYLKTGVWGEFEWQDGILVSIDQSNQGSRLGELLAEQAFLKCLAAATAQQRAVSHNRGTNYAPDKFVQMPEADGTNKLAFERAMERLFSSGQILADQFLWKDSHRKAKTGLKAAEVPAPTPEGLL